MHTIESGQECEGGQVLLAMGFFHAGQLVQIIAEEWEKSRQLSFLPELFPVQQEKIGETDV